MEIVETKFLEVYRIHMDRMHHSVPQFSTGSEKLNGVEKVFKMHHDMVDLAVCGWLRSWFWKIDESLQSN